MNLSASLDFGDEEEELSLIEQLETVAGLYVVSLAPLKAPTPSDQNIRDILDFFGPWGTARQCWHALRVLETGRIGVNDDEDFDTIAARVRRQCRQMIDSGRVKAAGQSRQRHAKPAPEGQGDLFGGVA